MHYEEALRRRSVGGYGEAVGGDCERVCFSRWFRLVDSIFAFQTKRRLRASAKRLIGNCDSEREGLMNELILLMLPCAS